MGFFNIDGKFFKGMTEASDFFILGILTVVFSIPVVTAGAAVTAAYYVGLKEVENEEGYVWKAFWKSFRENFKQAFLIELVLGVIGALLALDIRIAYSQATGGSTPGQMLLYLMLGLCVIFAAILIYVFALLARFENTVFGTIRNALILAMHHFPQTLIMCVATYGIAYVSLQYFVVYIVTIPLILYIDCFIMSKIFKQLQEAGRQEAAEAQLKQEKEESQDAEAQLKQEPAGSPEAAPQKEPGNVQDTEEQKKDGDEQ